MNLTDYKTKGLDDGVWLEFDGAQFLVASSKSNRFTTAIARRTRKLNQTELRRRPEILLKLSHAVMAEECLLDWKGVTVGDEPFPCTPENKAALMDLPDFRDWLATACGDLDNYREEALAADAAALKSGD